jgi:hypothetical protein
MAVRIVNTGLWRFKVMNFGIKKGKPSQGCPQKNKSEHAQFTEINLVQPTQVSDQSTLEFNRNYARLGFLTCIDKDFLPFSSDISICKEVLAQ